MAEILVSVSNLFRPINIATCRSSNLLSPSYGTLERANLYFSYQLHCQLWITYDNFRKQQALIQATRFIERLNFVGSKAVAGQALQFPRGTDTSVPVDIEYAAYEIAYALLKGVNPSTERDNTFKAVQGFGQVRTEHRTDTVKPWIVAGIPSLEAWNFLRPYILPRTELDILRSD